MNNVIFYHIYAINHWKKIVYEQIGLIVNSGLYDNVDRIFCGIVGKEQTLIFVQKFIKRVLKHYGVTNKFVFKSSTENSFEYLTLKMLQDYAKLNDSKVLYLHTKGVTATIGTCDYKFKKSWRKCMEHFCITRWARCVKYINIFDVCGAFYRESRFRRTIAQCSIGRKDVLKWMNDKPIFARLYICNRQPLSFGWRLNYLAGNFWWTTTKHIRRLPELQKTTEVTKRGLYEKWILHKRLTTIISLYNHHDIIAGKKHNKKFYQNH